MATKGVIADSIGHLPGAAPDAIRIVRARPADSAALARMIDESFARFVAPSLGNVTRVAIRLFMTERALRKRLEQGCVGWCAVMTTANGSPAPVGAEPVGYAELRGRDGRVDGIDHLSLLFTAVDRQGQGIARRLMRVVEAHLLQADPPVRELTVHASEYAVPIYERLGFAKVSPDGTLAGAPGLPQPMRRLLAGGVPRHPRAR